MFRYSFPEPYTRKSDSTMVLLFLEAGLGEPFVSHCKPNYSWPRKIDKWRA